MIVLANLQYREICFIESALELGVNREGDPLVRLGARKEFVIGMTAFFNQVVKGPASQEVEQQGFLSTAFTGEALKFTFDAWEQDPGAGTQQRFHIGLNIQLCIHTSDPAAGVDEHVLHRRPSLDGAVANQSPARADSARERDALTLIGANGEAQLKVSAPFFCVSCGSH